MVALALDIGETRIGIAVSSRDGKMAMPVKVLPAAEVTGMAKTFRYLVEDYEPDILVSGRPLTMAGEPGPQAERVAAVAQKIADELDLPLEFEDERLSSQEAKRIPVSYTHLDVYKRQALPRAIAQLSICVL